MTWPNRGRDSKYRALSYLALYPSGSLLNTRVTRRELVSGVAVPIPLASLTSLEPKTRWPPIPFESYGIRLKTPFSSGPLLPGVAGGFLGGSLGVLIAPLARSLTET